ncbi:MAG: hypothetical protein NTX25_15665 [Proteobacteria bacterium]|nr:hypothetical protein [Pseudomonadota bacterium]
MNSSSSKALEKRIKRQVYAKAHTIRIIPAPGWTEVCKAEVQDLLDGFSQTGKFSPKWIDDPEALGLEQVDFRDLIAFPQCLLSPQAIFWRILDRRVGSFGELIEALQALDTELYLPKGSRVRLKVQSFQSRLYHEGKLYELISEQLASHGWVCQDTGEVQVMAEQRGNRLSLFLALGPYPLHHRHYKSSATHSASLQECLAASAILWWQKLAPQSDWYPEQIVVPFAGSGTLLFETYLRLSKIPAFLWRAQDYGEQLAAMPKASLQLIRKRLLEHVQPLPPALLIEKEFSLAEALKAHLEHFMRPLPQALAESSIEVLAADIFDTALPARRRIFLPLNPPYGLRLHYEQETSSADFYGRLGRFLRLWPSAGQDLRGFILVPDDRAMEALRQAIGPSSIQAVQGFMQGGQHIRCAAFQVLG